MNDYEIDHEPPDIGRGKHVMRYVRKSRFRDAGAGFSSFSSMSVLFERRVVRAEISAAISGATIISLAGWMG
jgi:hypothetical protein